MLIEVEEGGRETGLVAEERMERVEEESLSTKTRQRELEKVEHERSMAVG